MIRLAIGLVHNKGALGNAQQIVALKALLQLNGSETDPETGDPAGRLWYTLPGVVTEHEIQVYQVVPFGVTPPNNFSELVSWNVLYGSGDEDKTGEHPRFFNWLLKRGTDNGADIALYLMSAESLTAADLGEQLARLELGGGLVLMEPVWGKVGTVRLLREINQLSEPLGFTGAVADLKDRIAARGLRYG